MSASISTPPAVPPVSIRTAAAILGTMVLLIVALTAALVRTSVYETGGAEPPPAIERTELAER